MDARDAVAELAAALGHDDAVVEYTHFDSGVVTARLVRRSSIVSGTARGEEAALKAMTRELLWLARHTAKGRVADAEALRAQAVNVEASASRIALAIKEAEE